MSAPQFSPIDEPTRDLLTLVADAETPTGQEHYARFLAACKADADAHQGFVSVNRVRAALTDNGQLQIDPRAFSAMWAHATGKGRPMVKTGNWITCAGSTSGNDGRPYPERRWVG